MKRLILLLGVTGVLIALLAVKFWRERQMAAAVAGWSVEAVDYHCARGRPGSGPAAVQGRPIALELRRIDPGGRDVWSVTAPAGLAGAASRFEARTDSIGGSTGIQWRGGDDRVRTAFFSFSDIVGERGPEALWVEMAQGADRTYRAGSGAAYERFVCWPMP